MVLSILGKMKIKVHSKIDCPSWKLRSATGHGLPCIYLMKMYQLRPEHARLFFLATNPVQGPLTTLQEYQRHKSDN
uniref:Uncharacterized protein n=1 Tax=Lepeophtheirus salmonis TaxID=72036 RepID=A0A0K2T609_LEPSM